MLLDRLLNTGSTPVLEQWLQFTDSRQRLIGEDIVNASTPNYVQKDLSLEKFQAMLARKVDQQQTGSPGSVRFDDISMEIENPPQNNILFHDGNNRSMEQLMSENTKNALMHSFAVEMLRDQYSMMETALKERVS